MREAGQLALTKRRTIRFEIDSTDNCLLLIDETGADTQIKRVPLEPTREVRMDTMPTGVTKTGVPSYTDLAFTTDSTGHLWGSTTVTGHSVWAARFQSDGSVVNAGGSPVNVTIYVWPPKTSGSTTPRSKLEVRAITMFGGTGAIQYWKNDGTNFIVSQ